MFLWASPPALAQDPPAPPHFDPLARRLVAEGFDTDWIENIYSDTRVEFLPDIARVNVRYVEDTAVYRSFSDSHNIAIAKEYLTRHRPAFESFERKTGVPASIVAAILLVETKCGRDTEKAPVLDVLSTIAASAEPAAVRQSFEALRTLHPDLTIKDVARRARKRSRWAYKELKAFLKWKRFRSVDELRAVRGSWAGALGLPQFMPSSVPAYGLDGNGDGKLDLYDPADAIASVCNYLRKNGWKPNLSEKKRRKVILTYNRSGLYADAVLRVAGKLGK